MAHDKDTVQVDLTVQRMGRGIVPGPKLLEVFEMNDGSAVVLSEVASIEEVHVDSGGEDPGRREQLAEIKVSGGRILQRVVVAVRKHGEGKGASPAGHAHMSIERHVRVGKWPGRAPSEVRECRHVDAGG